MCTLQLEKTKAFISPGERVHIFVLKAYVCSAESKSVIIQDSKARSAASMTMVLTPPVPVVPLISRLPPDMKNV